MNHKDFLSECKKFSVNVHCDGSYNVILSGASDRVICRLDDILENHLELKAAVILNEAINKPELLDAIQERAAIRWSSGLSDSLFKAVLCNLKPLDEKAERDNNGELILRPRLDWQKELKAFEA